MFDFQAVWEALDEGRNVLVMVETDQDIAQAVAPLLGWLDRCRPIHRTDLEMQMPNGAWLFCRAAVSMPPKLQSMMSRTHTILHLKLT